MLSTKLFSRAIPQLRRKAAKVPPCFKSYRVRELEDLFKAYLPREPSSLMVITPAESVGDLHSLLYSKLDLPLTSRGLTQALSLKQVLNNQTSHNEPPLFLQSGVLRALQTALSALGKDIDDYRPIDLGREEVERAVERGVTGKGWTGLREGEGEGVIGKGEGIEVLEELRGFGFGHLEGCQMDGSRFVERDMAIQM